MYWACFAIWTEDQKEIPTQARLVNGLAWGLTEANTGSDAMRMQCVAKKDGDWLLMELRIGSHTAFLVMLLLFLLDRELLTTRYTSYY